MPTRNQVPRVDGEGSLGTSSKKWGSAYVNNINATNLNNRSIATDQATLDTHTQKISAAEGDIDTLEGQVTTLQHAYAGPLVASTVAGMTDQTKVYVYTGSETGYTAGNWYYYDGSAWVSGGVYNATAFETDTTLTASGAAADAKVVGDNISRIDQNVISLGDGEVLVEANWVNGALRPDGVISPSVTYRITTYDYFSFSSNVTLHVKENFKALVLDKSTMQTIEIVHEGPTQILANKEIKICIMRTTENTSETADIEYFRSQLYIESWLLQMINTNENKFMIVDGAHKMFRKVVVIGDSLSSGYVYDSNGGVHTLYDYSWGAVLASEYNADYTIAAFGGAMAKTWYESEIAGRGLDLALQHPSQAYIIGLGQNDLSHYDDNTVGSTADIDLSDYTQNADSFYGWYAKIIQRMYALNSGAVFCLTIPVTLHPGYNTNRDRINSAIRNIVAYLNTNGINVTLLDLYADYGYLYNNPPISSMYYSGHYQACGYALMANIIAKAWDKAITNNPSKYRYLELL